MSESERASAPAPHVWDRVRERARAACVCCGELAVRANPCLETHCRRIDVRRVFVCVFVWLCNACRHVCVCVRKG